MTRVAAACLASESSFLTRSPTLAAVYWLMRKMTNSAGLTGEMPTSITTWPASITSGGLVSASHLTKKASSGVAPNSAPSRQVRVRKLETEIRSRIQRRSSLGSNTAHWVPSMIDSEM